MLDVDAEAMWNITLSAAATTYTDWEEARLHTETLKYPSATPPPSLSTGSLNRYANEWAIIFTPSE